MGSTPKKRYAAMDSSVTDSASQCQWFDEQAYVQVRLTDDGRLDLQPSMFHESEFPLGKLVCRAGFTGEMTTPYHRRKAAFRPLGESSDRPPSVRDWGELNRSKVALQDRSVVRAVHGKQSCAQLFAALRFFFLALGSPIAVLPAAGSSSLSTACSFWRAALAASDCASAVTSFSTNGASLRS